MFKKLYNSKLIIFSFIIITALISCDGRDRAYKTNAQVLEENNLLETFSKDIKFVPESRVAIVTDTILSNGFQIKMQYHSIENHTVSETIKTDNEITTKIYYKNFEAKLHILKNGITINQSLINKELFGAFADDSFWKKAIMQYVWIDYETSTTTELHLNTSFNIPNTETYKDFILVINKLGAVEVKEKNQLANLI